MERIQDSEYVQTYSDYDYKIHIESSNKLDGGYVLPPKINGEPYYVDVLWKDIVRHNQNSKQIKNRQVRFKEDMEELALKQLRIDINRDKNSYSRDEIEWMILNPNERIIKEILAIDDISVIDTFISQLTYLKNLNKFVVSEKIELYIRARKEELKEGMRKTELPIDETIINVELGVVKEVINKEENNFDEDEIIEKEVKKVASKPTRRGRQPKNKKEVSPS